MTVPAAPTTTVSAPSNGAAKPAASAPAAAPTTTAKPASVPQAGVPAQGQAAAPASAPQEKRYVRVIDGKRVELTRAEAQEALLSEWSDDEVLDLHSLRRGAHSRMEQAAIARREADARVAKLVGSPEAFGEWLRAQPDQDAALRAIEASMSARYQESLQSPEQRALREAQDKVRQYEERERKAADEQKIAARKARIAEYSKQLTAQVTQAAREVLGIAGAVPPHVVHAFMVHAERSLAAKQPVDVAAIARIVQREQSEHARGYVGALSDEHLDALVGERFDKLAALRAARAQSQSPQAGAAVTAPRRGPQAPPPVAPPRDAGGRFSRQSEAEPAISLDEAFRRMRGR